MSGREAWAIVKNIPAAWKVGVLILTTMFTLAAYAQEYRELPKSVRSNTDRLETVERKLDRILSEVSLSNCLAAAAAKDEPYQQCFIKYGNPYDD